MTLIEQAETWGTWAGIFIVALLAQYNARVAKKGRKEVKECLLISEEARDKKLKEIHTLVNSRSAEQLRTVMLLAERVAALTNNDDDKKVAEAAFAAFETHMKKEADSKSQSEHDLRAQLAREKERFNELQAKFNALPCQDEGKGHKD